MNSTLQPQRGFTLVEVMIVVVIIGLLAAMAIPAWQKVKADATRVTMDHDARQLASAAQMYFCERHATSVPLTYADGVISGPLSAHVGTIGRNYTGLPPALTVADHFSIGHLYLPEVRTYDAEGVFVP